MDTLLPLAARVAELLKSRKQTIAVAESCTGGLLSALLTEKAGASGYFLGGVVAYHNRIKRSLLGVPNEVLRKYGAVSSQTAVLMAGGVRKKFKSHIGISITGIAGPSGGTKEKPVGLVYIAVANSKGVRCKKFIFSGTRSGIRLRAAKAAAQYLHAAP